MIISTLFFTESGSDCLGCQTPEILTMVTAFFLPLGIGFFPLLDELFLDSVPDGPIGSIIVLGIMALHVVLWYLISCFIILFYDKFKKPKKP